MKDEDLKKKDWQLLTARSEMTTIAYLTTIMENQAVIISELKKVPIDQVLKTMNQYQKENYNKVSEMIEKDIPLNPDIDSKNY